VTETSRTTLEEAASCPKCDEPGAKVDRRPIKPSEGRPGYLNTFCCMNARCKWGPRDGRPQGEKWFVQENPDGTIIQPHRQPKKYEHLSEHTTAAQVARDIQRQLDAETAGGAELRGRF
jgi:hypothetical protein